MPIGTYLLFNGRHDEKTRLWLLSMSIISLSTILVAVRPIIPYYLAHELPWLMHTTGFLLMVEAIRRESRAPTPWWVYGVLLVFFATIWNVLHILGYSQPWGLALYSSFVSVICSILWWMLHKLRRQSSSKSLLLLEIGVVLYGLPSLLRVLGFLYLGTPDVMNVYKFSVFTNLLVFSFVLAVLFIALGYWGFTLEKSERERSLAEAGEDRATQEADRFRQLVEERDRLLVMNSRFSTVSALSSFSAMLIHDITQPLQTLQLGLERIRSNLVSGSSRDQLERDVLHLESTMDLAGELVVALRRLMQSGEAVVKPVAVLPLFKEVDSILSSEALKRRVTIALHNNLPSECRVKADAIMLQRIVINLISNALNQFSATGTKSPQIDIRLTEETLHNEPFVVVEVTDNGGGFPAEVLERVGHPWSSERQGGLGLALMLTKQLMGIWGGQLEIANRTDGAAGAIVRILLPKA